MYTCFDTIFGELRDINDLSVFVKMDVEGAEYDTLPQLMKYSDKINGITMEIHDISKHGAELADLLEQIKEIFYIAHTHGNNQAGVIENSNVPSVLEMTFINKKIVSGKITLSRKDYPIKGLDAPCLSRKPDCALKFSETI
jgi:hypothetical protein